MVSDLFISKVFPVSSGFSLETWSLSETSQWLLWYRLASNIQRSARFLLGLLAFVASGPSLLFPESWFSPASLSKGWDSY